MSNFKSILKQGRYSYITTNCIVPICEEELEYYRPIGRSELYESRYRIRLIAMVLLLVTDMHNKITKSLLTYTQKAFFAEPLF